MYAWPLWTTSQLQNNAMLILRGMKVEAPWHISMPMCLKANFTLHASGTKPLKEFAFQQNITFPCLFLNLCPNGAPISHFLASVHNHFCVKLSSLSCNKQKKMPVEKVFFFFFFLQSHFLEFCWALVFSSLVGISWNVQCVLFSVNA